MRVGDWLYVVVHDYDIRLLHIMRCPNCQIVDEPKVTRLRAGQPYKMDDVGDQKPAFGKESVSALKPVFCSKESEEFPTSSRNWCVGQNEKSRLTITSGDLQGVDPAIGLICTTATAAAIQAAIAARIAA